MHVYVFDILHPTVYFKLILLLGIHFLLK